MSLEFKVLSHACLLIKTESTSIIIDPWLLGSCYWRSWWNFPKAKFDISELEEVDAVIISHVHWDHWHGPTLKKFFKDKTIIIPDEPGLRSRHDLKKLGFETSLIKHGVTTELGDLKIFCRSLLVADQDKSYTWNIFDGKDVNSTKEKISEALMSKSIFSDKNLYVHEEGRRKKMNHSMNLMIS